MATRKVVKKSKAQISLAATVAADSNVDFNIVGIGASAGGLDAFEQFFRNLKPDSGMAFVLISHLDPDHESMLTEILQRTTTMPVVEALDQMRVEPDHVYVIPPNRAMDIFHGALQLSPRDAPHGERMVIDAFMRSLAEDQGERAIGIILSGTGTDGTLGLRAIRGAGGITLVQDPSTAKYDGMPQSAIDAGDATYILPVEKMPQRLLSLQHKLRDQATEQQLSSSAANGLNQILMVLRSTTGHDFSQYKKSTIGRRIERRMSQHNIESMETYARFLKENTSEVKILFKELLINVTSFFRDAEAFVALKQDVLPLLLANKTDDYVLRVWVAGCASGEEAYSIAILLREFMDSTHQTFKTQIYATDLDDDAITVARTSTYPANIAQDVSAERLAHFFDKQDAGYKVKKSIRDMVVFAVQNVVKDPPFTNLDLLCCRNLMIYLEPELQNRLLPAFHYALKPGGMLFLSPSESTGNHTELFTPFNRKWKFYRTMQSAASARAVMYSGLSWAAGNTHPKEPDEMTKISKETNFAELTKRALLKSFAPASVVTDLKGNILFVHGDTGKYLRPAPGQPTLNAIEMARDGLQLELRNAFSRVAQGAPIESREVSVKSAGEFLGVSFDLHPLRDPNSNADLLLISFHDAAVSAVVKPGRGKKSPPTNGELRRIEELERELSNAKDNLQATLEEEQAANEELKSSNEEMQSTNEELQSTIEELETSKEELRSVNEELLSVNTELQTKIEQVTEMRNDMKNLLDNTNIGTLFLDTKLNIKRFTPEASKIYRLVALDIGRALNDIKSNIVDDTLLADAQTVLDSLIPQECEVRTHQGEYFLVRIRPYRTLDNVIDGVVLTFTDINKRVAAEAAEKSARKLAEGIVNTVREPLIVLDAKLRTISASRSFYATFQVAPEDTLGRAIYELGNHQWDIPKLRELLETILPNNQGFEGYMVEHDFQTIGHYRMLLNARRITDSAGDTQMILLAFEIV